MCAVLALAGIAAPAVAGDGAPAPKRAGVVSLMGESPQRVAVGTAAAGGSADLEPPPGWEIDYFVETVVGRHVAAHGFEPVVPDKAARAALPSMEEFARRERLDAIFVVSPGRRPSHFKDSGDAYTGYGRWSRDGLEGCFAALRISLMDVKQGKALQEEAESRVRRIKGGESAGKPLAQISKEQAGRARECVEDSIEDAQDAALRRMGY